MNKHRLVILSTEHGDETVTYAPEVAEEVQTASARFEQIAQDHYWMVGYMEDRPGATGEIIDTFDTRYPKIIALPIKQLVGG